jgi:hypothetical protein
MVELGINVNVEKERPEKVKLMIRVLENLKISCDLFNN